ncbi:hypothetical protein HYV88_03390 [Candidatus Woesearchaeota archaeon]|nr:hypothetical protein [Candidatus Woesearchaeota archaeon]
MEKLNKPIKKKPRFIRQQARIFKKIANTGWRAPKGMHSKLRRKRKGKGLLPSIGYASQRKFRGLSREGLMQVTVSKVSQLKDLTKKHGIILSRSLGIKKRLELLKKIKELGLNVLNIHKIDDYIKNIEQDREMRKETKKKEEEKKKKSKEQAIKKAEEKQQKEETQEEKENREKEEKRKVLEKQR